MKRIISFVFLMALMAATASGELVGEDKIFIRFTNTRPGDAKIVVRVHNVPNTPAHFGWAGKTFYVDRDGERAGPSAESGIEPGASSPWVDIGRYMTVRGRRSGHGYLSPVLCGVMTYPESDGLHMIVEVAKGPGTDVIRRINVAKPGLPAKAKPHPEYRWGLPEYPWRLGYERNRSGPYLLTVGLLVPTELEDTGRRVYTLEEALKWQLDFIEDFPEFGRRPRQIVFTTIGRPQIKEALGYNGFSAGIVVANLGDEISIRKDEDLAEYYKTKGLGLLSVEEQVRRFRDHLKAKGFDPLDLIKDEDLEKARALPREKQWQYVYQTPALPDKPRQYYESAIFKYGLWYEELAMRRRQVEAAHPLERVLAGANFSPHLNVWPDVRQWIDPFKTQSLTMTWTEDWWFQIQEPTPQSYGFLLDALRLAGSYHGAPMQFYAMPFRSARTDDFLRMNALALAHGAKILNHFRTESQVMTTWDYVDFTDSPTMYQAIHDTIHEVGAVEKRLYPAMPEKAEVAIMLSRASDTWDTEDLGGAGKLYFAKYNVNNEERKAIYLTLRHAQIPVDLITDADVAEGDLRPYRVLYLVGSEMLAAAVEPLKAWVRAGGVLYATGGAGLLDEYRQPLSALQEMYGIRDHTLLRKQRHLRVRAKLPQTEAIDTVTLQIDENHKPIDVPAMFYRHTFDPRKSARIAGFYKSDKAIGAVVNQYGKGKAICVGALAGLAYLRPAMNESVHEFPTEFPSGLRDLITTPIRLAHVTSPIEASDPLVEAQFMTGPEGTVAVLINWRQEPIDDLVVRFPGRTRVKAVRSLRRAGFFKGHLDEQRQGALEVTLENDVPRVRMQLEVTDYLLID